ncbi:MAG TPA: farnesyl diphosphate synthase [Pyrinomonadaceae bacterium]|nr:farnesyl diphosphate synthase [Pyrinomonadaceae bacterium]
MKAPSEILPDTREINTVLDQSRSVVEESLDALLPAGYISPQNVHQAIRWSVFAGGKRFRPAVLIASGQTFGAPVNALLNTACALEMIHTYSLIHDDLPSMDDDDLRRGRPTCHVKFGEATAILAGDALQALAFHTIAEDERLQLETRVRLISELSRAAGTPYGMVAGQALDIEAEAREVIDAELEEIHQLKTAALIICAVRCGAIIAGANEKELDAVTRYATNLGLLFQITDDLLDVTATEQQLGKTPGKDARSAKATYPALYGLEEARSAAINAHRDACVALKSLDRATETLRQIADFTLNRSK